MKPEEFPYITELQVNDCFAYKNFKIPVGKGEEKPFRHLILTGKNGSGKTTILRRIDYLMRLILRGVNPFSSNEKVLMGIETALRGENNVVKEQPSLKEHLEEIKKVVPYFDEKQLLKNNRSFVYAFFKAQRRIALTEVSSPTTESAIIDKLYEDEFASSLKQYLVNKKIYQAFDRLENQEHAVEEGEKFFDNLLQVLQQIYEDKKLRLHFVKERFEFIIELSDGRKITLNQNPDGYSALLSIILDLLVRVDVIRRQQEDFRQDPCGIVLIDEPESHLHLEMQYQVLPIITTLFPNIQLLVATHSPAVISSIPNAVVFDLTTQKIAPQSVVGSSFSELMVTHFGLDNEFSNIADKIIEDVQELVDSNMNPANKAKKLRKILSENEQYLTPSMTLAIESNILQIEAAV